ncbi:MAG: hypothetical protein GY797_07730 [Deltaproteobacteria bacterium]|nr:hypothetical protein [Deltaproteobacteria bacterium]
MQKLRVRSDKGNTKKKKENSRDDALDLARLYQDSKDADASEISELARDLECRTSGKIKSFT